METAPAEIVASAVFLRLNPEFDDPHQNVHQMATKLGVTRYPSVFVLDGRQHREFGWIPAARPVLERRCGAQRPLARAPPAAGRSGTTARSRTFHSARDGAMTCNIEGNL